jgi:hypothetical protein
MNMNGFLGRLLLSVMLISLMAGLWVAPAFALSLGERIPYAAGVELIKDQNQDQAYPYYVEEHKEKDREQRTTYYAGPDDNIFLIQQLSKGFVPVDVNTLLGSCASSNPEVKSFEFLRSVDYHYGDNNCDVEVYIYGIQGLEMVTIVDRKAVPSKLSNLSLP